MTNFDFSPLFRSSVGFDRLSRLFDEALVDDGVNYPPYNIEKTGDSAYRITMAVAGFGEDDISVVQQGYELVVSGEARKDSEPRQYLYRGIAGRSFERRFQLADHVKVAGAKITLTITAPDGSEATINMELKGDDVTGDWSMPNDGSKIVGKKLP
mgnify:CR=1 FL=1